MEDKCSTACDTVNKTLYQVLITCKGWLGSFTTLNPALCIYSLECSVLQLRDNGTHISLGGQGSKAPL